MRSFVEATWSSIEALRAEVAAIGKATTLVDAAAEFTDIFARNFDSVVLARIFAVLPFSALPTKEKQHALKKIAALGRNDLADETPCLCLLGTNGVDPAWRNRQASVDHLAIPLLNSASVSEAPMIAKLLSDLEVDLKVLDDGKPIATRLMIGGRNGTFYVPDALTAVDTRNRFIIPGRDFVTKRGVRTVFGMGGAYLDGTLIVAIFFCSEPLDRLVVDRFPSFISSFKMATARLADAQQIFEVATPARAGLQNPPG